MQVKTVKRKTVSQYGRGGGLAKDILRLIADDIERASDALTAKTVGQVLRIMDPEGPYERNRIWKVIKYLEAKNRISLEDRDGKTYVILTQHGRLQLNEDSIWDMRIEKPRRWDRKWRLVLFDLPVQHNTVRNSFRLKLEDLGFRLYQRSVFIYPYECHEEVHTIAKWYGIDEYIRYIVATEVHDMRQFAKMFDLI